MVQDEKTFAEDVDKVIVKITETVEVEEDLQSAVMMFRNKLWAYNLENSETTMKALKVINEELTQLIEKHDSK